MPSIYTPDATNTAQPADTDYAYLQAAELRTLKAYLASQLAGLGGPVNTGVLRNRNRIINGNFDVWQRAVTQSVNGYGSADRWYMGNTGTTKVATRQAFTLGQTDVPGNPKYYSRNVVTSVAGANNFCNMQQHIEDVSTFSGQLCTLSFYAKADAAKNIAVEVMQNFGTTGSPSADVTAISVTTCALTTSWQKFQISFTPTSVSGKTLGTDGNDYLGINFWFDAGSSLNARTNTLGQQSGTFEIAQVQLEFGGYATVFEKLDPTDELNRCKRFYQSFLLGDDGSRSGLRVNGYASAGGQTILTGVILPVQMRSNPTAAKVGTWAVTNCGQPTIAATQSTHGFEYYVTSSAAGQVDAYQNSADDGFTFNAEI